MAYFLSGSGTHSCIHFDPTRSHGPYPTPPNPLYCAFLVTYCMTVVVPLSPSLNLPSQRAMPPAQLPVPSLVHVLLLVAPVAAFEMQSWSFDPERGCPAG